MFYIRGKVVSLVSKWVPEWLITFWHRRWPLVRRRDTGCRACFSAGTDSERQRACSPVTSYNEPARVDQLMILVWPAARVISVYNPLLRSIYLLSAPIPLSQLRTKQHFHLEITGDTWCGCISGGLCQGAEYCTEVLYATWARIDSANCLFARRQGPHGSVC